MNVITTTILRNNLAQTINEVSSRIVNIDLFEDLMALMNKSYLNSIKQAREEYKKGQYFSHKQAFGEI